MSEQHFGETYGGSAPENYERYFVPAIGAPLATDVIEVAALRPGERVLDVACGTGVVARLASQRVGASGTVTGLDVNPGMLAVARAVTPSGTSIEWRPARRTGARHRGPVAEVRGRSRLAGSGAHGGRDWRNVAVVSGDLPSRPAARASSWRSRIDARARPTSTRSRI